MELTLNIYEGKKVVKTYKAQTIDFSFGVVEDVLDALNFESMKTGIVACVNRFLWIYSTD